MAIVISHMLSIQEKNKQTRNSFCNEAKLFQTKKKQQIVPKLCICRTDGPSNRLIQSLTRGMKRNKKFRKSSKPENCFSWGFSSFEK